MLGAKPVSSLWCLPTWLKKENLVILAELHEACYALCKLHHILDSVGDLNGTLLPQSFSGLPGKHGNAKQWASRFISALSSSGGLAERHIPQTTPQSPGRASSISASQGTWHFSLEGCFHKLIAPVIWTLALPLQRGRMHCPMLKCDSNVGFCAR